MVTREEVIKAVEACREQAKRLREIAPDTVPGRLADLMIADDVGAQLDKSTKGKDEVKVQLANVRDLKPGTRDYDIALDQALRKKLGEPARI